MAHEHQTEDSREKKNEQNERRELEKRCSDIVLDWLMLFGKIYREELSEELALAYRTALADLKNPDVLHAAFIRAVKICKFRPTPAEVFDAYEIEASRMHGSSRPKYLDEPRLTQAEREKAVAEIPRPNFDAPTRINYEAMKEHGIGMPHTK